MKRTWAACAAAAFSAGCLGQEFVQLPADFDVRCVSGDGRVVGGAFHSDGAIHPALWTSEGGVRLLRLANGEIAEGTVFALNPSGGAAAGTTRSGHQSQVCFRWTGEGLELLPPPSFACLPNAYGISDDGRVVTGDRFIWVEGIGTRTVGSDQSCRDGPNGVSGDGRVCAGPYLGGISRWFTDTLGREQISIANDSPASLCKLNRTGDVVVGSYGFGAATGFIWTPSGFHFISETSILTDTSGDGRVSVGRLRPRGACYYTEGLGAMDLAEYAASAFGIDVQGAILTDAQGVSDDGRTIVGRGSPNDWLMRFPAARPGDFNGDDETTVDDLVGYLDCFVGEAVLPPSAADVNRDDFTDWADFDEFLAGFGG